MKTLLPLLILGALVSCGKREVNGIDSLSEPERAYLRNRAIQNCLTREAENFDQFAAISNAGLLSLKRGSASWKFSDKKEGEQAPRNTSFLQVWNVRKDSVIFLMQKIDGATKENKFIKIDTKTNSAIIEDLKYQSCSKDPYKQITSSSGVSNLKIMSRKLPKDNDNTMQVQDEKNYTFSWGLPAYFSSLNKKESTYEFNNDDVLVSANTVTFIHTLEVDAAPPVLPAHADNVNVPDYCVVEKKSGDGRASFALPLKLLCTKTIGDGPGDWKLPAEDLNLNAPII